MTEGLTGSQVDKSYIFNDVCKSNVVDNDQRLEWTETNFRSIWWIQIEN